MTHAAVVRSGGAVSAGGYDPLAATEIAPGNGQRQAPSQPVCARPTSDADPP